ncbi:hypothetical protein [Ammoniphilus sp. 3BR4]|uniref:hypothetical protein n=1 Tax=Ammoniphilus sp. 3BR4 TaxID=3158265 RepID=UPI00346686A7
MMNPIENVKSRIEQFSQQHQSDNIEELSDLLGHLKVDEGNEEQVKKRIADAESLIQEAILNFSSIQGHVETIRFLEELEMELMELSQNLQGRRSEDYPSFGMLE